VKRLAFCLKSSHRYSTLVFLACGGKIWVKVTGHRQLVEEWRFPVFFSSSKVKIDCLKELLENKKCKWKLQDTKGSFFNRSHHSWKRQWSTITMSCFQFIKWHLGKFLWLLIRPYKTPTSDVSVDKLHPNFFIWISRKKKCGLYICTLWYFGRIRLGSIWNKNNWKNARKHLFGSYSHSGIPGFPFWLFCSWWNNYIPEYLKRTCPWCPCRVYNFWENKLMCSL